MKKTNIWAFTLLLFAGIGLESCNQTDTDSKYITVDVKGNYPKKEISLQDFMDVEYIPLETTDEFITQGAVLSIGDKYILIKNYVNDGDIYVFDRKTGKGIRKINRKGQGGEEYAFIVSAVLDEDNEEIFVNSTKKILVYDLYGNFKRSFNTADDADYMDVFNYDKNNLICYDMTVYYKDGEEKDKDFYHSIISKQDGSVIRGISIPFKTVKAPFVRQGDVMAATSVRALIPCQDNWLLVETSSDTIYSYRPDKNLLSPFIIKQSSGEPEVLITMGPVTDRYYFFKIIEKKFDFSKGNGFPSTALMYDKEEDSFFKPVIFNADYINKQEVNVTENVGNGDVATYQNLTADRLIEAYSGNNLKSPLKEIAAKLNEESNPVIMLMKYKK